MELLCDIPHAYPPSFGGAEVASTKKILADSSLELSNLNAFTLYAIGDVYNPSWIDYNEQARNKRIQHTIDCIKLAEKLGCPNLSTEPGGEYKQGMSRPVLERIFIRGIEQASKAAELYGVRILIEPEPGLLIENSSQFLRIIREMPDNVGLNFDIGHFFCVREDPSQLIPLLADYIFHFHFEDISAQRIHKHLIPGLGAIDFASVFRSMESMGYRGFVTLELYPYQNAPAEAATAAFRYITEITR